MTDAFSDVLHFIRLKSCVYFVRDFWSPFAMQLDGNVVAQFHAVLRGNCVIEANGKQYQGAPGDVFLFPQCDPHVIADAPGRDAVSGPQFMESLGTDAPLFAEGESPTQLLCGHYEYRGDIRHPLIDELAPVIHVRAGDLFATDTMHAVIPTLTRELANPGPGSTAVVENLAEILLIQTVRAHVEQERIQVGVMAGLLDRRLARAFQLVHANYQHPLTLDDLGAAAGMSRSAFALRFKTVVGMTPIAYLALWRMCSAHDLLTFEGLTVAETAIRVGYESDIAFSRAFKRHFDKNPGAVRRG